MIKIVDYGLGNIQAFANLYKRLHIPVVVARTADELAGATKIILPGVGAFDHAMARLNESGMREILESLVQKDKVPVLGICVGMQMLANSSDEGVLPGLGWVPGRVREFRNIPGLEGIAQPHMGWNDVKPVVSSGLFKGLETDARFYFLHSFFFECQNPDYSLASANYGLEFSCAVANRNVYGVQFHPEKSHDFGMTLLKNFSEI
ncbi:imidazole glycerol phosphate synthase subunit HisH [Bdellovibrio bacteriovorus]|uniref:Imidazole glycerol phosphate synthase subunit HisH n=1 Tax=Bdellovibrio bacteriovorus (strain ATCC 15356 / DSM 50701 / NCIMB 9529 / HD100) TaxID=264462 RepID=HIS5_BDEBA|nr:imidazole glycerol phosphate synthase subunit HisH [Bdellovibrio bacteriovorus]P60597.1 RecName: Full=Imidazole glycerol phosphate synthase subunit HisH; AltName: Full=IGP synthase glutaminase subunit; AltName: Full=IGP synthase subunit HisH; AltName: Full=ImGP synthase subunit HisH; Short=IGPS subunit HisH [Bdellovibrio bacteriovorus HD100]CAE79561.1 Imidazole glycerol phosphate synthase subunit hisH [Bdellovibrio bacteriovorus HD100]